LQPELGQTSCNPCPLRFGAYPGSVICRECPSGTFRNSTAQPTCELCPAGTFSVQPLDGSGILDCIACEIGKYANNTGNGRCDVCPPGSFGTSGGQGLCTPCPIGKSNQFYGSLSCIECLSANVNGTIVCKECLEGQAQFMQCCEHRTSRDDVTTHFSIHLLSGQFVDGTDCRSCGAGRFNPNKSGICYECPRGTFQKDKNAPVEW